MSTRLDPKKLRSNHDRRLRECTIREKKGERSEVPQGTRFSARPSKGQSILSGERGTAGAITSKRVTGRWCAERGRKKPGVGEVTPPISGEEILDRDRRGGPPQKYNRGGRTANASLEVTMSCGRGENGGSGEVQAVARKGGRGWNERSDVMASYRSPRTSVQ